MVQKILRFVTDRPKTVVAACLLFVLSLGTGLTSIGIDASVKNLLPHDLPEWIALQEFEDMFGASEIVLIAAQVDDLLDAETLEALVGLEKALLELDDVSDVLSPLSIKYLEASKGNFKPMDLIPVDDPPQTEAEKKVIRQRILDDDMYVGNIISDDLHHVAFVVFLEEGFKDETVVAGIERVVAEFRKDAVYTGLPITRLSVMGGMQGDLKLFLPLGILVMVLLLVASFRTWIGAILPLLVVIMSIISTFGLMGLIGEKIKLVTLIMPVMLIAVANDYGIHLVAHYLGDLDRHPNLSKKFHVLGVTRSLGIPVLTAGLTTVAGFLTLTSHVIDAAKIAGVLAAFGIIVAFVFSLAFIPAMLMLLPIPPVVHTGKAGRSTSAMIGRYSSLLRRFGKPFTVVCLLLAAAAGSGIPSINVDTDPIKYFHKEAPIRKANEHVNRVFGGSSQLNIVVHGNIKEPAILREMGVLQKHLEQSPNVGRTQSVADMIRRMNRAFHDDDPEKEIVPDTLEAVAQFLLIYSFNGDLSDFERMVDLPYENAQVAARVNTTSATAMLELTRDTDMFIQENLDTSHFTSVTGFVSVLGKLVELVVRGQMLSLLASVVLIFLIAAVVFRSALGGALVVAPLAMAMVSVFGLMGYSGIELNIATAMLASIVIGVGVDYTIHFLWHYRQHLRESGDPWGAVETTLATSGRGIIVNAVSVLVGFSVMLFSNFMPIFFFGFLLTISISACLVGSLAILPVLVTWFRPSFLTAGRSFKSDEQQALSDGYSETCLPEPGWLSIGTRVALAACLAGVCYIVYWVTMFVIHWAQALPPDVGFWAALWVVIKGHPSIVAAIYIILCLNAAGVAEFKFKRSFARAFLLAVPLTPFLMIGLWARRNHEIGLEFP